MRFRAVRTLVYAAVVAAVAIALQNVPELPERRPAEDLILQQAAVPSIAQRFDTLGRGETLNALLRRAGLSDTAAREALRAATTLDHRRIPAGMPVTLTAPHADSTPNQIVLQLDVDRVVTLARDSAGGWVGTEEKLPWSVDTIAVAGEISSNLYNAVDESAGDFLPRAARQSLTYLLAEDVFGYRVDMSRELRAGDRFKVVAERSVAPNGAVRINRVLAATFSLSGAVTSAVRYVGEAVSGDYFDQDGKSMRAAFRAAPLQFRRISSSYGFRVHPVLGGRRLHKGTDYAANSGTPVLAMGDGVVVRAGWGNGYGNVLEIRHRNGYVTRYAHLKGFAKGVRAGSRVTMNDVVAYVGSTGMSTAPHLHFEVLVGGVQRDPRSTLRRTGGDPIPSSERTAFLALRDRLLTPLERFERGAGPLAQQTP